MSRSIDNTQDVMDSRDVIKRFEEITSEVEALAEEAGQELDDFLKDNESDEAMEYKTLKQVCEDGENSPDWTHGETLISDSYFTDYIEELINDCYEMPKEINSGGWPWRHIKIDFEAAADEAKQDYFEIDFDGIIYWIRA
jgi:hypothetical protein